MCRFSHWGSCVYECVLYAIGLFCVCVCVDFISFLFYIHSVLCTWLFVYYTCITHVHVHVGAPMHYYSLLPYCVVHCTFHVPMIGISVWMISRWWRGFHNVSMSSQGVYPLSTNYCPTHITSTSLLAHSLSFSLPPSPFPSPLSFSFPLSFSPPPPCSLLSYTQLPPAEDPPPASDVIRDGHETLGRGGYRHWWSSVHHCQPHW